MEHGGNFAFSLIEEKPHRQKAVITIGREHIDALYNEALLAQKMQAQTYGFSKGSTPLHYIEQNFRSNIVEHLKELLFTHCVVHFLYESLSDNKIVVAGDPDLVDIQLHPEGDALFVFSLINVSLDNDQRWKRLHIKPPERKFYKDLDRQVESIVKEEIDRKNAYTSTSIALGDWVFFEVALVDKNNHTLLHDYKSSLWIRLNAGEDDKDLQELFLGKKVGDSFLSQSIYLQEYMSLATDMSYTFRIDIKDSLPDAYFSFELFNHHFNLKSEKETHAKLIEVFSTRNDISQRRETIEAALRLLCKQYFFFLPNHLLERQQHMVLQAVQDNPDYHVYKSQPDFKEQIRLLAEKQLKETIIIDAIAYQEGIKVSQEDIRAYLNLLKRPRMKQFLHFILPPNKVLGQDIPLSAELVKRFCLREKTLNHIIGHLIKKEKS